MTELTVRTSGEGRSPEIARSRGAVRPSRPRDDAAGDRRRGAKRGGGFRGVVPPGRTGGEGRSPEIAPIAGSHGRYGQWRGAAAITRPAGGRQALPARDDTAGTATGARSAAGGSRGVCPPRASTGFRGVVPPGYTAVRGHHGGRAGAVGAEPLPVPFGSETERARAEWAVSPWPGRWASTPAMVVHAKGIGPDFTFFIVYGRVGHLVDMSAVTVAERAFPLLNAQEVNLRIRSALGRKFVVVGACIGTDAHTVGIDAILNVKGHAGEKGLEYYREMRVVNMGAQVGVPDLVARRPGRRRLMRCSSVRW